MDRRPKGGGRLFRLWLGAVSWLVPAHRRDDWRDEWLGEVWHRGTRSDGRGSEGARGRDGGLWTGAVADAWQLRRLAASAGPERSRLAGVIKDDLVQACRSLVRAPAFGLFTVTVLGLGIGVNTAVFTVAREALVGALPFPEAERMVQVWERRPAQGRDRNVASYPDFLDWREQSSTFEAMAAVRGTERNASGDTRPEPVQGAQVAGDFFEVAGVAPVLGRTFGPEAARPSAEPLVVLGHGVWTDLFGGDPGVIGKTFRLDLVPHTVIGVMPAGFDFPYGARFWMPLDWDRSVVGRGSHGLDVFGRLRDGVTVDRAWQDLDQVARRLETEYPESNTGHYAAVYPLRGELLGDRREALILLAGSVAFVLLIVCVNVANMQLARSLRRAQDLSVRASLGASHGRLVRQVLLENTVLAGAGAVLGLVVAAGSLPLLRGLGAARIPWATGEGLDPWAFALALVLGGLSAVLFGLAPALQAMRLDLAPGMADGTAREGVSRPARRWQGAMVVAQVALAFLLLAGAGLMSRNLFRLLHVDLGYDVERVLTADVSLPQARYGTDEERLVFYRAVEDRLRALPGVEEAATAWIVPLGDRNVGRNFLIEGRPEPEGGDALNLRFRSVTSGYFDAMGIEVLAGRGFSAEDSEDGLPVALASETLVERYWPGGDPVGVRIRWGNDSEWITIVGVVEEIRHDGPEYPPEPELYVPLAQETPAGGSFVVRAPPGVEGLAAGVRQAVQGVDPDQAVARVRPLADALGAYLARQRDLSRLAAAFAVAALVLATMGVYGVVSYGVSLRTREFGIRMALGGRGSTVLREAMGGGVRLVGLGLLAGLVGMVALARLLEAFVSGLERTDPLTLSLALLAMAAVSLAAVFVPARRATRVDPMASLRSE